MATTDDITKKIEERLTFAQTSAEKGNWPYMKCCIDDALIDAKKINFDITPRIERINLTYYTLAINFTLSEAEKAVSGGKLEEANRYLTQAENYAKSAGVDISVRVSEIRMPRLQ
ncbi:hypothetical protein HZC30_00880 [Candidatus Woesearchaeota archaeon]|nr:hypothetical protein [Candidatus Woesearchaeota archaeon]